MGQVITRVEDIGNLQGLPLAAGKGYVRRSDNQQWETRPFALLDAVNTIFAGGLQASNLMGTNTGDQSADQILPPQTGKAGQYLQSNGSDPSWQPAGSVTSVGLSAPSMFNVTVSPITSSGSLTFTLANQGMRTFLAGPGSGVPAAPTFRAISGIDLPIYQTGSAGAVPSSGVIGSPTKVLDQNGWNTLNFGYFSDTLPIASGGTGQTTANAAFNALAPAQATNGGKYLTTDGTNTSWASVSGGSAITALTGDVTATGPGSAVATLATVTIAKGGTGQITANAAFNALAPSQTGQNGNFLTTNGTNTSWAAVTVPVAGNPSTNVTLSATNGSAGTFMRSDAAPALSQAIAPTWTALHTFNRTLNSATVVTNAVAITPTASTTGTGGWAGLLVNVTQSSDTGSGTQRLVDFQLGGTSKFYVDSSGAITSQGLSITKASSAGGITMLSGVLGATGYTSIEMGRTAVDADIGIAGAASNFAAGS